MSKGLDELLRIGIDKIHEQTHITKRHIDAVLNERFEDMSRVQFLGFVSIFQREYNVKLDDLRQKALEFYEQKITTISEDSNVFSTTDKKHKYSFLYMGVAAILFIIVLLISFLNSSSSLEKTQVDVLDNSSIKSAQVKIQKYKQTIKVQEKNTTKELDSIKEIKKTPENNTTNAEVQNDEIKVTKEEHVFEINPKRKVWIGYIDLSTYKRYQKVLKNTLTLDSEKTWLLVLGNSNVKFNVDGEMVKYKTKYNLRLLYKNSKLTKISVDEFKRLNRGKKW